MLMFDYKKLAKLAVNYAVHVQPGEKVLIQGSEVAADLIRAIYVEVLRAGGYPLIRIDLSGTQELFYKHASDKQIEFLHPTRKLVVETYDAFINILSDYNTHKLEQVNPKKLKKRQTSPGARDFIKTYMERDASGELKWTIVPFPCDALAQDAKMDTYSYAEFISKALKLDKDDPAEAWRQVEKEQARITDYLDKVETIHIVGEDTDLTLSVKGRKWINSAGHKNLPDGEIFTTPVENSVNGKIRFTYPGIFQGKEIENIYLEVENGKVIKATAEKGEDLLKTVLEIEGADGFGEFAIGTNYGITAFTKNMLFDEKIGGSIHMALGMGFPETGSKAMSTIHWDILKDMSSSTSKMYADDKLIYEAGQWKI
jgi:aminopeptidase